MKYIQEYRDKVRISSIISKIEKAASKPVTIMEVCGGHTMSIHKFGIKSMLPENVNLISGPGCPVCVTGRAYIDHAIALSRLDNVIITTYGDLMRVPGSNSSLMKERADGGLIKMVYSALDSLEIAKANPDKEVVFLGIGFETTAPATAVAVKKAYESKVNNFSILSAHKVMPPAMEALIDDGVKIDAYIAPGHVSTISGAVIFESLPEKYGLACVVAGFEPLDILQTILMLLEQINSNSPKVEIQYSRVVSYNGNEKAKAMLDEVFAETDVEWRGFGIIPKSGLKLKEKYAKFDAELKFDVQFETTMESTACICGEILKGKKSPHDCKIFGKACTPENPIGACMVSSEGACNAFYKYSRV